MFQKYFSILAAVAIGVLLVNAASDAWFSYRDQRVMLNALLRTEASSAAAKIEGFLTEIRNQLGWTVQQPWTAGADEQRKVDALRVLRQAPAVISIALIDGAGIERVFVSRLDLNKIGSGIDRAADEPVVEARTRGTWYSPVSFYGGSEPFMTIAVSGSRRAAGIAVAEINLKHVRDVVSSIRVGTAGHAFVLDRSGRLIAHPDISKVLRGDEQENTAFIRRLREAMTAGDEEVITARNAGDQAVVAAMAAVTGVDWILTIEQPLSEAFVPIRAALARTGALLLAAALVAAALAYWLARRMTGPISRLEEGAACIGAGDFDHRIDIGTGDELQGLAARFNTMAAELAISRERSERITRLKRFLAPQVAELVERAGDDRLLAGQRSEVVVVFCDLRGFTAFAAAADPSVIMRVLSEYYEDLGRVIAKFGATLVSFQGDGLTVLVNAPVPCPEPALRAVEMAIEMQTAVRRLITTWRGRGHRIGFGVGLAQGPATVGQIGSESRVEYTAVGSVVNLASRLCASAEHGQVLVGSEVVDALCGRVAVRPLGLRRIRGYDKELAVFELDPAA